MRGLGKQSYATVGLFIGYYFIAIPAALLLAIKAQEGVIGLWRGVSIGVFTISLFN